MNRQTLLLFAASVLIALNSCSSLSPTCEEIRAKETIMLLDVSDKSLYEAIENDIQANFGTFMGTSDMGKVASCQSFKLSVAHLCSKDELDISSASIGILKKNQSHQAEKAQAKPTPLVNLIKKKLDEYKTLSNDKTITANTQIANVLLKAIIQSNENAETTIMLFSDGVENFGKANFYKHIPKESEIYKAIEVLTDPLVLKQFKQAQEKGVNPKIIFVLKSESDGKVNKGAIKAFWKAFFDELKIDVQFIDNLTNKIEL